MSSSQPFIRRVKLLIGPLAEDQGGGPTNQAFEILSDGGRNTLRVAFSVKKTILGAPNASTIRVYNLKESSRNRIKNTLTRVRLLVGWENTELSLLTSGAVLSSISEKQGPDIITDISVMDGFGGIVKGIINQNFAAQQTIESVVRTIANQMPGVAIGAIDVDGRLGRGGLVLSMRCSEALDMLAAQFGFSWSIQNGIFQALQDSRSFSQEFLISNDQRNLIKATPILTGPMQDTTGAQIQAILNPALLPGANVRLKSDVEKDLNGLFKAHNIEYQGDTHDSAWDMTIESFKFI